MTHLTEITLNLVTVAELRLWDCYDWHQRVWQCFPGRNGEQRDFLSRIDQYQEGFRLLIVSSSAPTRPEWCPPQSWRSKPIPKNYFAGRRYEFQLYANPTKKVTKLSEDNQPTKNGRRVPLTSREEYVNWIRRKGKQGGFVVDEETLCTFSRNREYFEKHGMRGLHCAVEFRGALEVTDPSQFHETFRRGIGTAKAFGFGLLVIARIK